TDDDAEGGHTKGEASFATSSPRRYFSCFHWDPIGTEGRNRCASCASARGARRRFPPSSIGLRRGSSPSELRLERRRKQTCRQRSGVSSHVWLSPRCAVRSRS